jgi:POT family proton-dependent oligopeptide transporter
MQTLLVLYMTRQLLLPGHVEHIAGYRYFHALLRPMYGALDTPVATASAIFGFYTSFVYLTPILGGFIADRLLGRTRTVIIGATLMSIGHFLMAFDATFIAALLCLLFGVGCFKGNLASQVGSLYAPNDLRRADAFQIYYLFINAAVIIAPMVTGTLGEKVAWHLGFGIAGVGMVIGLIIYLIGRPWLPTDEVMAARNSTAPASLTRDEIKAIVLLVGLLPVLAVGAIVNQQIFNSYLLWVPEHVNMQFLGWTIPTTWLVTFDAIVSVSLLVGAVAFWRWWAARAKEPDEITKITLGLAISTLGALCLVGAAVMSRAGGKASFGWVIGFELLNSAGFANVFPVGLALYARAAPKAVASTFIAIYYLHLFLCNNLVGRLGTLLERMTGTRFWLLHAALVGAACAVAWIVARFGKRLLSPGTSAATA